MGDIKRSKENKMEPVVDKKEVAVNSAKENNNIQIHFGNVKLVELKLLESINKQLAEILLILKDAKK